MLPFGMNSKVHEHARPKLFGFQLLVSRLQRVLKWIEVGSQKKYRIFNKSSQHLYLLVLRNACPHDELEECYICFWTHLLLVLVFWSCQRSFGCWPPVSVLQRTGHARVTLSSHAEDEQTMTNDPNHQLLCRKTKWLPREYSTLGRTPCMSDEELAVNSSPLISGEAQGAAGVSPVKIRHD